TGSGAPTGPHRRGTHHEATAGARVRLPDQPGFLVQVNLAQPVQVGLAELADPVAGARWFGSWTQGDPGRFGTVRRERAAHRAQWIGQEPVRTHREGVQVDVAQRVAGPPRPYLVNGHRRHRPGGECGKPGRGLIRQPYVLLAHRLAYRVLLVREAAA